ncbi:19 kDa protein having G-X-X-X-Q-X-W motif protein [Trichosporon asahii var. asahii CBS 8904]|uniref:19 kDa protein having G-X-X-X-Q-X-W motif protein n=3 Tax=Trichosporon asahii TaxID=82508 RepID=K1VE87_TRIAC|nr:19 kDa protein having G-X-X-X-Q-X-W motif protein [Trichosporon asahii var. asahii CBS 8904]BAB20765.1 19 kDa protein having G-X-X-X-Q-X-W motif [Trichosporon asahii]
MLSILAQITVLCALVAAQCEPSGPTSSSSSKGPEPTGGSVQFHPSKANNKCIDVEAANFSNGAKVQVYDCNGSAAQNFEAKRGPTQIKVKGQNLCLDAGTDPKSGSKVHLWQCYPGLKQQSWYITGDNRLALENQGLCLDLTDGSTANGNGLQVWECGTGNKNQEWNGAGLANARRRRTFDN